MLLSKVKRSLLRGTLSLLLLLIMTFSVAAQSFAPVFEWVKRFQSGEKIELKVHLSDDSFVFLHSQTTDIDQATFERLLISNYQRHSKGPVVEKIQVRLKELGYYGGPVDGDFGVGTEKAVKSFQKAKGLAVDGNVGPQTWKALFPQGNTPTPAIPQLKILPSGELELVIRYEINKLLYLKETRREDKSRVWEKTEFIRINSYPLKYWPDFIKQAISQGLMEYEAIEDEENLYISLIFKQADPSELQFGKQLLKFSDEFYEYMKISREFESWVGSTDKFVILVHEPHWSLAGQYQLVSGLKAFLDINSQYKFRFLVEGYFTEETKYIPTAPLLKRFSTDVSTISQVFSLLRNYFINGPYAYRLLYDPNLPAVAIDDPELIKKTPAKQRIKDLVEISEVLGNTTQKLEKLPSNKISEAQWALNMLGLYASADIRELKGQALIDRQLHLAKFYDILANSLKELQFQDFASEISFLENQSKDYQTNSESYQIALERNTTMARNISEHFNSKEYSNRIPVVFIGSFHTPAVTSHLHSEGIGYVVIEPRVLPIATEKEQKNFNEALGLDTRPSYLKKCRGNLLALQVAPIEKEITQYYEPFLKKREAPRIKAQKAYFQQSFQSLHPNKINLTFLNEVLETNGFLNNTQISFASDEMNLPPLFQEAFASFSFDPEGGAPRLIFFHPEDKGWEREDRYRFLQKVSPIIPYEGISYKEFQRQTRKVRFYQDQETNRIFCNSFDPESQTFYLSEGDRIKIFNSLPLPREKGEKEAPIYFMISVRDVIYYEKGLFSKKCGKVETFHWSLQTKKVIC